MVKEESFDINIIIDQASFAHTQDILLDNKNEILII